MIRVVVHGAEGRMGRLVTELLQDTQGLEVSALVTEPGRGRPAGAFHPRLALLGQDEMAAALLGERSAGCVVVDFSLPAALPGLLAAGERLGAKLVVGTTGHDAAQRASLAQYARSCAVVQAANFSVGIPALQMVLELLARVLPAGFDAAQVETHHVTKADKPSGTARLLASGFAAARGTPEPPTHSLRLGGVIGEHSWTFSDPEETLTVTHRAHSRRAFLRGIVPAVRFAAAQRAGLYTLQDVLQARGGGVGD